MTFQTQKIFLGKDQAFLHAEFRSERTISYIRIAAAGLFCGVTLFNFLLGTTAPVTFIVQICALAVVFGYSSYFIFSSGKRVFKEYFPYLLSFSDIALTALIIWAYRFNAHGNGAIINGSAAGIFFILIIFTAFHHKASLSLFSGITAVVGYTVLNFTLLAPVCGHQHPAEYPVRLALLILAALLVTIVSRNNSRTVRQVISSETRYHSLVHRLPEMLFTLDAKGNFLWANMAGTSILGIPAKTIAGRNISMFLTKSDSLKLDSNGIRGTYSITDFTGNEKYVDCIIQPVTADDSDGIVAFDGIMSDVTDREMAIQQREEMVQRLFQYQKMESLGMLASGMAHDFNNILQTVNDLTDIIIRESKEESTKRQIELINETMVDARFLVSELFALGRKKPLDFRHVNLNSLLEQVVPHFSKQLGPNFLLALETPEETLYIEGDPDHLKRVFQNLIGNARDAMPEGGNITVSCEKVVGGTPSDSVVRIRVSDTGTGIPPELTEKVFDPFFTTKKPGKGTGLGLALVRRIIMLHNGTITIEKTGYEGTVFLIEIPLSDEEALSSDTKAFMLNRMPASVLLLDDDSKIREVLKIFLREFKYTVFEAADSDEAMKLMRLNAGTNVVIMDWKLGNDDPHQVIKNLRSINRDIIVIVVSGYPPEEKSLTTLQIARWFTKPYDRNLLDIEIQRSLHKMQSKKADAAADDALVSEDTTDIRPE